MKNKFLTKLSIGLMFMAVTSTVNAATIWNGSNLTFTKEDGADWTLTVNQDFLTSNVIITRANTQMIFNIVNENSGPHDDALVVPNAYPSDTEWAVGDISNYNSLTYMSFLDFGNHDIGGGGLSNLLGSSVLHLISDDIYIPISFNSWSEGAGGFSYTRGTASSVPEPTSLALLSLGLAGFSFSRKKLKTKS